MQYCSRIVPVARKLFARKSNLKTHIEKCHPSQRAEAEPAETFTDESLTAAGDKGDKKRKELTQVEETERLKAEKAEWQREVEELKQQNRLLRSQLKVRDREVHDGREDQGDEEA
ncbi:MAG: hypothetical protein M1816_002169 [Peltula sp. TS41687]|nr:MAG: hypothetical protein M1816_002169 [Peltula sp. TS41687]